MRENLGPAIDALIAGLVYDPAQVQMRFALGVALDRRGDHKAAEEQFRSLHPDKKVYAGAVDSWRYAKSKLGPSTRMFSTTRAVLRHGFGLAPAEGLILE